jgi:hypothetical protein
MNGKTYLLLSPSFIYTMLAISIFGCIPIFLNSLFLGHKSCKADWEQAFRYKVDVSEYKRILKLSDEDLQDINQLQINRHCH